MVSSSLRRQAEPRMCTRMGLWIQGLWSAALVLPRTVGHGNHTTETSLQQFAGLRHLGSAALLYPHIAGLFRLRRTAPQAAVPACVGHPSLPAIYIAAAAQYCSLLFYRPQIICPGSRSWQRIPSTCCCGQPTGAGHSSRCRNRERKRLTGAKRICRGRAGTSHHEWQEKSGKSPRPSLRKRSSRNRSLSAASRPAAERV
jgi:hypothetical protein